MYSNANGTASQAGVELYRVITHEWLWKNGPTSFASKLPTPDVHSNWTKPSLGFQRKINTPPTRSVWFNLLWNFWNCRIRHVHIMCEFYLISMMVYDGCCKHQLIALSANVQVFHTSYFQAFPSDSFVFARPWMCIQTYTIVLGSVDILLNTMLDLLTHTHTSQKTYYSIAFGSTCTMKHCTQHSTVLDYFALIYFYQKTCLKKYIPVILALLATSPD